MILHPICYYLPPTVNFINFFHGNASCFMKIRVNDEVNRMPFEFCKIGQETHEISKRS